MEKLVFDFEIAERNPDTGALDTVAGAGTLFCIETLERNGASIIFDSKSGRMLPVSLLDENEQLIT